jgi:outer membrane protein
MIKRFLSIILSTLTLLLLIVLLPDKTMANEGLTLDQAIEKALEKSPKLAASESELQAAKSRTYMARSGIYPQVNVHAGFTRTTSPMWAFATKLNQGQIAAADFNPDDLNDPDPIDNYQTGVSVVMPVFDSGQTIIGIDMANLAHEAEKNAAKRARQEVIFEVTSSYARALFAKENLLVIKKALESAKARQEMVSSLHDAGLIVKGDLLRANVYVADIEQKKLMAENGVEVSLAALNASMGGPIASDYAIKEPFETGEDIEGTIEEWVKTALANRPDLKQMRLVTNISDKDIDRAKAAFLPAVFLSGSWETNSKDLEDHNPNYTLGAMVNMDLFSGGYKSSRIDEAKANNSRAVNIVRQFELGIEVQTRQAYLNTTSAKKRTEVAKGAVSQAEEGLRITADRYESGLYTIVNLLDAETALQQARSNLLISTYDYVVAKAELMLAAGIANK